jgi:hypothetical protein
MSSQRRDTPKRTRKYSSEEIHRALFPEPPKPRTLAELKQAIEQYIREKYGPRDPSS